MMGYGDNFIGFECKLFRKLECEGVSRTSAANRQRQSRGSSTGWDELSYELTGLVMELGRLSACFAIVHVVASFQSETALQVKRTAKPCDEHIGCMPASISTKTNPSVRGSSGDMASRTLLMPWCFLCTSIPLLLGICVFYLFAQLQKSVSLKYAYDYVGKGTASAFGIELTSLEQTGGASEKWEYNVWKGVKEMWDNEVCNCERFPQCLQ
jgi:hypothetical protein